MTRWLAVLAAVGCLAANEPGEQLPDPAQEARARALFEEIRCVVCQNESIDSSEAELARDLRGIVRQQVAAGRSDAEIKAFLVERYGEFVLFRPRFDATNAVLWLTPFAIVLVGGGLLWLGARSRARRQSSAAALSEEEEARLAALADDRNVT
jgi:cytochrome c-type biogenesis protein CcmH